MANVEVGYECCLCHGIFTDWGNNPWPLDGGDENARCCDACNECFVIPARLERMLSHGK